MPGPVLFRPPRRVRRGAALTLVFTSLFVAGAATGSFPDPQTAAPRGAARSGPSPTSPTSRTSPADRRQEVVDEALRAEADGESPLEAAERAVSRDGDRWSAVYSPADYEEFEDALDGTYTGVGLWAGRERDGSIRVTRVSSGSPAATAGLRAGDVLRSVDGRAVAGLPVTEVVSLLRGDDRDAPAGTTVRLGLRRADRAWSRTLRRARLSTDSVTVRTVGDGTTVVAVTAFTRGSGDAVREAVRRAPAGHGVILDLRGNSGGLVTEAVTTASVFLDGGLVATYDVDGEQHALHARTGGATARPVVTLVDGGTMSAAELLTGALQDRGRAVVVGSRTFGKGSVQMPSTLPDGSVAELTVGHYRTPAGRAVDGRGITPDLDAGTDVVGRAETVLSGLAAS